MTLFKFSIKDNKAQVDVQLHPNPLTTSPSTPDPIQVPNVFVVPPEEDQTPTWCCFDAAQVPPQPAPSLATSPDIQLLDSALASYHTENHAPIFHRDAAGPLVASDGIPMPKKSGDTRSVVDAILSDDYLEDNYDTEEECGDRDSEVDRDVREQDTEQISRVPVRNAAEDSDVIEVVKVKRNKIEEEVGDVPHPPATLKHSATFKSRASKAFRSLKGTLRSRKPRAQEVFAAATYAKSAKHASNQHDEAQARQRPTTPAPTKRSSLILSQIFTNPSSLKTRPSQSSFDSPRNETSSPSPTKQNFPIIDSSSQDADSNAHDIPFSSQSLHRSSSYSDTNELDLRAPSPSLSTHKPSRRFSKINLQRIFSFSPSIHSSEQSAASTHSGRTTPTLSSSPPSTFESSSTPQTPTSVGDNDGDSTPRRSTATRPRSSEETFDFISRSSVTCDREEEAATRRVSLALSLGLGLGIRNDGLQSSDLHGSHMMTEQVRNSKDMNEGDVSFEMRLDSLHFDSLSFDADQFTAI